MATTSFHLPVLRTLLHRILVTRLRTPVRILLAIISGKMQFLSLLGCSSGIDFDGAQNDIRNLFDSRLGKMLFDRTKDMGRNYFKRSRCIMQNSIKKIKLQMWKFN